MADIGAVITFQAPYFYHQDRRRRGRLREEDDVKEHLVRIRSLRGGNYEEAWEGFVGSWNGGIKVINCTHELASQVPTEFTLDVHCSTVSASLNQVFGLRVPPTCIAVQINRSPTRWGPQEPSGFRFGRATCRSIVKEPSNFADIYPAPEDGEALLRQFYGAQGFQIFEDSHDRWELIEVSHPLGYPIQNHPTVLCDPRTVYYDEMENMSLRARGHRSRNKYLKHNREQRWFYLDNQASSELLVRRIISSTQIREPETQHTVPMAVPTISEGHVEDVVRMLYVLWFPNEGYRGTYLR